MLIANDSNGRSFNLADNWSRKELANLRKHSTSFQCPQCKKQVILKAGQLKIPHFAHKTGHSCQAFSEGESGRHLKGKADLYHWLNQFRKTSLEPFLPDISQRPDLLSGDLTAVEYQCSAITAELFSARTAGYLNRKYTPFWIYGGKSIEQQYGYYKFSAFQRLFFQFSPQFGFWMTAYCPDQEAFTFYHQLTPLTASLYSACKQVIPIEYLTFPPMLQRAAVLPFTMDEWIKRKHYWIQSQLYHRCGIQHPLIQTVYRAKLNLALLPEWMGVPVRLMALLKNHPLEWQFYLWNDLFGHTINVTAEEASEVLERRIQSGHLQKNIFPQIKTPLAEMAEEYLQVLNHAGIQLGTDWGMESRVEKQREKESQFAKQYGESIINRLIF